MKFYFRLILKESSTILTFAFFDPVTIDPKGARIDNLIEIFLNKIDYDESIDYSLLYEAL